LSAILPKEIPLLAVGGVEASNIADYLAAGVAGFGIGTNIFKPGMTADEVGANAGTLVASYDAANG
jgi:2-dehydro-3-deoxyphosphogalactonate aldolase